MSVITIAGLPPDMNPEDLSLIENDLKLFGFRAVMIKEMARPGLGDDVTVFAGNFLEKATDADDQDHLRATMTGILGCRLPEFTKIHVLDETMNPCRTRKERNGMLPVGEAFSNENFRNAGAVIRANQGRIIRGCVNENLPLLRDLVAFGRYRFGQVKNVGQTSVKEAGKIINYLGFNW